MSEPLHVVCPHCHTTNRVKADQLTRIFHACSQRRAQRGIAARI